MSTTPITPPIEDTTIATGAQTEIVNNFTTKYGTEISDDEILQYTDEVANEPAIPDQDFPHASQPLSDAAQEAFYKDDGLVDSGFPSGIPRKIDKLYKFRNAVTPGLTSDEQAVLLLRNKLTESIEITGSYNAICVDLDTCGHVLTIDTGSALAAL